MKKIILACCIIAIVVPQASARFVYKEIDPICSISGTNHTSFPGEISDTSDWSIPTAYEGECVKTSALTKSEENRIFKIMKSYFERNTMYSDLNVGEDLAYESLNEKGRTFMKQSFFPAVAQKIQNEKNKNTPDSKLVAVLNYAAQVIGYDYSVGQPK
ncbi:hypothetical protein GW846_00930 [Candidatus Gracilibacteria bacterium]|nr:hypothetical protein [Candidatus Gracilibacteria bacterium]